MIKKLNCYNYNLIYETKPSRRLEAVYIDFGKLSNVQPVSILTVCNKKTNKMIPKILFFCIIERTMAWL